MKKKNRLVSNYLQLAHNCKCVCAFAGTGKKQLKWSFEDDINLRNVFDVGIAKYVYFVSTSEREWLEGKLLCRVVEEPFVVKNFDESSCRPLTNYNMALHGP